MNNETTGISAEVAIANVFDVPVSAEYVKRADLYIINEIEKYVSDIFERENLSEPLEHIAEEQNPIDFILNDGSTLSVKTNKKRLGKVAPQIIGQPTSETYFDYFDRFLDIGEIPESYEERVNLFKKISIENIDVVMNHYWDKLFECKHLLYFYNIFDSQNNLRYNGAYIYLEKPTKEPYWDKTKFSFSKTIQGWNESCTVRYMGKMGKNITLGEFQAHKKRNCFKFRFNMKGLLKLIETDSI